MSEHEQILREAIEALYRLGRKSYVDKDGVLHWELTADHWIAVNAEAALDALAALRQQAGQAEPVARVCHDNANHVGWNPSANVASLPEGTPLYTHPPRPKVTPAEAAAPELLEALQNLMAVRRGEGGTKPNADALADAAIAKATGASHD